LSGKLKFMPACSLEEELIFPKPFGRAVSCAVIHSELATFPESFREKGLKNCWFKIVYPQSVKDQLKLLVGMGFSSDRPIRVNGGSTISPRGYLTAMALKGIADSSSSETPKDVEVLRVTAHGSQLGLAVSVQLDCIFKAAHGLSAGAMGVGFPASIAAQLAVGGRARPGVNGPERALPVDAFFDELLKRKIFRLEYSLRKPVS
jgi:saccharopine dehydrogenase-like NADP-dependent oxidoreductase